MSHDYFSSSYKKGLVLGLTLAETVILIIFCLLLLFFVITKHKDEEIKALSSVQKNLTTYLAVYNQLEYERIQQVISENFKKISIAKSLTSNIKKMLHKKSSMHEVHKILTSINQVASISTKFNPSTIENYTKETITKANKLDTYFEKIKLIDPDLNSFDKQVDFLKQIHNLSKNSTSHDFLTSVITENEKYKRDIANVKGQMANLKEQLSKIGNGLELPPCWADINTGKPEYIFDIALQSNGFMIKDRKLPHRIEDQKELPLSKIHFNELISTNYYLESTKDIYEWSLNNECRFFVRVFDMTGNSEKSLYKKLIRILEMRFYKFETSDDFGIANITRNDLTEYEQY